MGTWMWILLIVVLLAVAATAGGLRLDVWFAELRDWVGRHQRIRHR